MRPFPTIIIFAALMLVGLAFVPRLGVQLHPSATLPSLQVSFGWAQAPAIQLEREVTSRIEGALATLADVEEVNSVSRRGRGSITIRFRKGTDLEMARFEIASRIRRLYPSFPPGVSYPVVSAHRAVGQNSPILTYTLVSPRSAWDMANYLQEAVLPSLSQIQGVDRIHHYGYNPPEYQLIYDTEKLRVLGVSVSEIEQALQNYFNEYFVGMGSTGIAGEGKIPVVLRQEVEEPYPWDKIPVANKQGQIIWLTDVVKVQLTESAPGNYYRVNGKTTLMLTLWAEDGANQVRLAQTLKEEIDETQRLMPDGWQFILTTDNTEHIRRDLRRVGYRMVFSFLVLMVFVLVVSRNFRYLLMILLTVLANLLLAITWYNAFSLPIHLYSLAGITVSFGIIIDNSIVMAEHLRQHGNRRVFLAILAATLTTLGSLSVIFLLGEQQQAQLADFAAVVLVNLALSLLVAWFFVPALTAKLRLHKQNKTRAYLASRRRAKASRFYLKIITGVRRFRWAMFLVFILGFGLPIHLLPSKLEGEGAGGKVYNATVGSSFYQRKVKNTAEKVLGGSFRLFSRFVFERSYFTDPERTTLYVRGQMPDGATVHQLNEAVLQMEHFLGGFIEIEQFQSRVSGPDNSMISIVFYPEYDRGSFPHILQSRIIQKAISIGGAEWNVWGVGQGFSNVLRSGAGGSSNIILEGYNYDILYRFAEELRGRAVLNPRIPDAHITGAEPWRSLSHIEFFLNPNSEQMALHGLTLSDMFQAMQQQMMYTTAPGVLYENSPIDVNILSQGYLNYSLWDLENLPLPIGGRDYKTPALFQLDKGATGNDIHKYNQEYRLHVSYSFMGPHILEQRVRDQLVEEMNDLLPLGYRARVQQWGWQQDDKKQWILILLVVVIIYFICSILLESLLQPLAIIGLIPISFSGLFLTFYLFNLNFDQGGWAAFILLSGLSVNAGLYILNDFNNLLKTSPSAPGIRLYLKAFHYKITPVLLTIGSTLIGLVPFVLGQREPFWFAFAAGTMGGLVFSLLGVFFFFPVFLRLKGGGKNIK